MRILGVICSMRARADCIPESAPRRQAGGAAGVTIRNTGPSGKCYDPVAVAALTVLLDRFRRLSRVSAECWQGGLVSLPTWVEGPDGGRLRPRAALWVSRRTGLIHLRAVEFPSADRPFDVAVRAFAEFGLDRRTADCRPARVEVTDTDLAAHLRITLDDPELDIAVTDALPDVQQVLRTFAERVSERPPLPDATEAPGVTVDRLRAFAEAAKAFYEAAPWRLLTNDDLIRVEDPEIDPRLQCCVVLGNGGEVFGLSFFEGAGEFETMSAATSPEEFFGGHAPWAVHFDPLWDLPFGDADIFETHGLPVAGPAAYPWAVRLGLDTPAERPDATRLAWMEGLLRALAATTEAELDAGRWRRCVTTADGARTFELALPDLLEPGTSRPKRRPGVPDERAMERFAAEMGRLLARGQFKDIDEANRAIGEHLLGRRLDDLPSTASTPLERAQDLMYEAFEARGRRQIQLARQALSRSPDCADAYVLLAERAWDPADARRLYAEGVAAGERALGHDFFADAAGHVWGHVNARPYMRARLGVARATEASGDVDGAVRQYQELLRLDTDDHQGVRYLQLSLLLREGRDEDASVLLAQFGDEPTAIWRYGGALLAWREGDRRKARSRLRAAIRANRLVPAFLTGREELPDAPIPSYAIGTEEEAILCTRELVEAWERTPDALDWLAAETSKLRQSRRGKSRRRKGR